MSFQLHPPVPRIAQPHASPRATEPRARQQWHKSVPRRRCRDQGLDRSSRESQQCPGDRPLGRPTPGAAPAGQSVSPAPTWRRPQLAALRACQQEPSRRRESVLPPADPAVASVRADGLRAARPLSSVLRTRKRSRTAIGCRLKPMLRVTEAPDVIEPHGQAKGTPAVRRARKAKEPVPRGSAWLPRSAPS